MTFKYFYDSKIFLDIRNNFKDYIFIRYTFRRSKYVSHSFASVVTKNNKY